MTESLAQRALALTNLCDLAAQLGGSVRIANGAVFYRTADTAERPIGNVAEAVSILSAERDRHCASVLMVPRH